MEARLQNARNGAPLIRDRTNDGVRNGPGSAAHRGSCPETYASTLAALRSARDTPPVRLALAVRALAFLVALLAALAQAPAAFAHASLVRAEPADGAVLAAAPTV